MDSISIGNGPKRSVLVRKSVRHDSPFLTKRAIISEESNRELAKTGESKIEYEDDAPTGELVECEELTLSLVDQTKKSKPLLNVKPVIYDEREVTFSSL
jgi:hypothetical protein